MPGHQPPASGPTRARQVTAALWLVSISVAFGLLCGAVWVITGQPGSACGRKGGWVSSSPNPPQEGACLPEPRL
jgi:hypothetical protein